MPLVRCLTESGIEEFREYLVPHQSGMTNVAPPISLLTHLQHSEPLELADVEVRPREFASRLEFARYFDQRVSESGYEVTLDAPGMWEWLTLYYFDQLCPVRSDGSRKIGNAQRYVPPENVHSHYLHLLKGAYTAYLEQASRSGSDYELVLSSPVNDHSSAFDQLISRPRLRTSPGVQMAARLLYFDETRSAPKASFSVGQTKLGEFAKHLRNLPPEYQLQSMSVESVLSLLPPEFLNWLDHDQRDEITSNSALFGISEQAAEADPSDIADILTSLESRRLTQSQRRMRSDRFRIGVLKAYESCCAISDIGLVHTVRRGDVRFEVEAAHIIPVAHGGNDVVPNGLALCRTLHWSFDNGMIWIDSELRVNVTGEVVRDSRNEWLQQFAGRRLSVPRGANMMPSVEALRWHAEHVAGIELS